ncbi:MAG: alpha/beta hydrolase-fold protein [Ginsengibacter sp.]
MKQFLFSFLFIAPILCVKAQTENKIVLGTIDSINSGILHEQRKVWVYVPNSGPNDIYAKQRYPVVYLLDGDAHFYSVAGMIRQLSSVNGNTICPEMIVVGIPNTNRTRDLTPTYVNSNLPSIDSDMRKNSGGGEQFISFIEKELIPHIDSLYPTEPYRVFIGHSLGGLTVINTLIHHTNLFNSYIAIDPSMWWDNQKLLKQSNSFLSQKKFTGKTLFLVVANTMRPGMDTMRVVIDTAGATIHIRSILKLANVLKSNPNNELRWNWKYYNEDDHGSVPLIGEYDALHFIFDYYKISQFANLADSSFKADSAVLAHFTNVSKQMGFMVLPPESFVNGLGYAYMQNKMFDKSFVFFKMNITNYPQSFNVYDSMGDFYDAKGDTKKAIEYYTKALTIKDLPDTREKLNKLKAKK